MYYCQEEFLEDVYSLSEQIRKHPRFPDLRIIAFIPAGGYPLARELGHLLQLQVKKDSQITAPLYDKTLIVDDLVDSGKTLAFWKEAEVLTATLHCKEHSPFEPDFFAKKIPNVWVRYWWEKGESEVQENITRLLEYIGEDPNREGLLKTPERIEKSYKELFSGYSKDPKEILTTFGSDGYNQIVLLKDIELFSMCEHHWLPFFGKAHVAYIPGKKIVGISKLARLVDIFARRLQIQERIGDQVTSILMEELHAQGAACIIEAVHMCMRMRGVEKQHSSMVTSSVKGIFMTDSSARSELLSLINQRS